MAFFKNLPNIRQILHFKFLVITFIYFFEWTGHLHILIFNLSIFIFEEVFGILHYPQKCFLRSHEISFVKMMRCFLFLWYDFVGEGA